MPQESDAIVYRPLFYNVWREHYRLRADFEALRLVVLAAVPESERARVLSMYKSLQDREWEKLVLNIGDQNPIFAEGLDSPPPAPPKNTTGDES